MDYETEEQQVEALKAWWNENGKAVIAGVFLGAAVIGGWTLWQNRVESQAIAASDTYSETLRAADSSDGAEARALADQLREDQPDTLYAAYANLAAARSAVEAGDLADAAKRLAFVANKAPQDDVVLIAKVRLARVQGATGNPDTGLQNLPESYPESFAGLVEEARGDLLVMTGDAEAARSAYEKAMANGNVANSDALTMKLNELAVAENAS